MVLYAIAFDLRLALRRMGERVTSFLCTLGIFIFAGTGVLSLLYKKNFLDYSALANILGVDPVEYPPVAAYYGFHSPLANLRVHPKGKL